MVALFGSASQGWTSNTRARHPGGRLAILNDASLLRCHPPTSGKDPLRVRPPWVCVGVRSHLLL